MGMQPQGEHIRNAVKWVSETRTYEPGKPLSQIVEEAAVKFDLSPAEAEWLQRFVKENK
jgi:hypothetical protein